MAKAGAVAEPGARTIQITPPKLSTMKFKIMGIAPYSQSKFSTRQKDKMMATQMAGQQSRSKKPKAARDFEADYLSAMYKTADDKCGIPATSIRCAMISACRLVGFKMTIAKMSVFVEADALDKDDATPLILIQGKHEIWIASVRNATGVCDLRARPVWREWSATPRITWDNDQFSDVDVANLLARAGQQVGLGEGRPDSRMSNGLGYGRFEIEVAK
jgi:hypothetical protein